MWKALVDVSFAIEPILQGRDHLGRTRLGLLFVGFWLGGSPDARDHDESGAIGRPDWATNCRCEVGQSAWLATIGRHQVKLRLLLRFSVRGEREVATIRRPAWREIALGTGGEPPRLAAGDVDDPDVREVLVLLFGQDGDHEGDSPTIRRQLGIGHEADPSDVERLKRPTGRLTHCYPPKRRFLRHSNKPPTGFLRDTRYYE